LFGGLFHDPEVAAFFSGPAMLGHMIGIETAWTRALVGSGVVAAADGDAALQALAAFDARDFRAASDRDGLPVPSLVAHLRRGLAPGPARAIHTGLTSQDVIDTALVLAMSGVLDTVNGRLLGLDTALQALEARHGASPLMARTRMQAALPATVSMRVTAWRRLVRAQLDRLPAVRTGLAQVQVGGAIGLRDLPGGPAPAAAEHLARELGLRLGPVWHTERSAMVELGHWFTLVAGALGKIGQDIALMAQQGVDEIALDGGGGSSAMPHKQNPVLAETLVALARHVAGLQGTLAQAMIHEQERSGAAWALEWLTLPAMAEATGAALRHAQGLVGSVRRLGAPG
jgi:3-carboxy-cis,cis-muconate cycloisomerase